MKARNLIHARIEENIRDKICGLRTAEAGGGCKDALQLLIEHSWERGERLDMQVSGDFRKGRCGIWSPGFPSAVTPKRTSGLQSGQTAQTPGMGPGRSGHWVRRAVGEAAAEQGASPSPTRFYRESWNLQSVNKECWAILIQPRLSFKNSLCSEILLAFLL